MKAFIKRIWKAFTSVLKSRIWLVVGFTLTWITPIIMLNEKIALTKNIKSTTKLTFIGLIVAGFLLIVFWRKIKTAIDKFEPKKTITFILKVVLKITHKAIMLGIIYFLFVYSEKFISTLMEWYKTALVSIAFGFICYIIDMTIQFYKRRKEWKKKQSENS